MGEYRTAQVTQSANPQQALVDAVVSAANAHPAWEYVGGFRADGDAGTSTYRNHIFKNLGSLNAYGTDFYAFLTATNAVTATATVLYYQVAEQIATHPTIPTARQAIRYMPPVGASSLTPTAGTNAYSDTAKTLTTDGFSQTLSTTSFTYRVNLTNNNMMIGVDGTPPIYLGLFEPFWTHANEFPLLLARPSATDGSFTRSPGQTAAVAYAFSAGMTSYTLTMGGIGEAAMTVRPGPVGARPAVYRGNVTEGQSGAHRGLLYGLLRFAATGATLGPGDTVTTNDGKTYENFGESGSTNFGWVDKGAP